MSTSPLHPYLEYFGQPLFPGEVSNRASKSTGTRRPSTYDKHIADGHRLKKLSFAPGMVDRFISALDKHLKTLPPRTPEEEAQFKHTQLPRRPINFFADEESVKTTMTSHVVEPSIVLALLALQDGYWPLDYQLPSLPIQWAPSRETNTKADVLLVLQQDFSSPPRDFVGKLPTLESCFQTHEYKNFILGDKYLFAAFLVFYVYQPLRAGGAAPAFPWAEWCRGCDEHPKPHLNPRTWQGEKCKDASLAAEYKGE